MSYVDTMKTITHYQIVFGAPDKVGNVVVQLLVEGWQPLGPPSLAAPASGASLQCVQAIVRYAE